VVAALAVPLVLGIIAAAIAAATRGSVQGELPGGYVIALTFLQDIGFIAVALLFARLATPPRAQDFGLRGTSVLRAIGIVVAVYVGFTVFAGVWTTVLGIDEEQTQLEDLGADDSTLALVLVCVLVCVLAPLAEEVLFRGYLFTALRNWRGLWPAALVSGAVFGVIHAGSTPVGLLVPLAVLGVGLALLYAWTGSLYPPIALHAVNNAIAFGVATEWTWQIAPLVVGATVAALGLAWLLGRALGRGPLAPSPAPA
jgi:membrane protease YdiL (CAAX protease family)